MRAVEIKPDDRYGMLVVIEAARTPGGRRAARCRCDCGELKIVDLAKLRSGHTRSCGCVRREVAVENARTNPKLDEYRHSLKRSAQSKRIATKHGMADHPHYDRWYQMVERCTNPDHPAYANYGGRGICVHPAWLDVAVFCAWMDANLGPCPPGMSFDRENNDGNYEPGNVRYVDMETQNRNRRPASEWRRPGG